VNQEIEQAFRRELLKLSMEKAFDGEMEKQGFIPLIPLLAAGAITGAGAIGMGALAGKPKDVLWKKYMPMKDIAKTFKTTIGLSTLLYGGGALGAGGQGLLRGSTAAKGLSLGQRFAANAPRTFSAKGLGKGLGVDLAAESIGFSPFQTIPGHGKRGPLSFKPPSISRTPLSRLSKTIPGGF